MNSHSVDFGALCIPQAHCLPLNDYFIKKATQKRKRKKWNQRWREKCDPIVNGVISMSIYGKSNHIFRFLFFFSCHRRKSIALEQVSAKSAPIQRVTCEKLIYSFSVPEKAMQRHDVANGIRYFAVVLIFAVSWPVIIAASATRYVLSHCAFLNHTNTDNVMCSMWMIMIWFQNRVDFFPRWLLCKHHMCTCIVYMFTIPFCVLGSAFFF